METLACSWRGTRVWLARAGWAWLTSVHSGPLAPRPQQGPGGRGAAPCSAGRLGTPCGPGKGFCSLGHSGCGSQGRLGRLPCTHSPPHSPCPTSKMVFRSGVRTPSSRGGSCSAIPVINGGGPDIVFHCWKWVQRRLLCEELGCVGKRGWWGSDLLPAWPCSGPA